MKSSKFKKFLSVLLAVLMLIEPTSCVTDHYEDTDSLLNDYNESLNGKVDPSIRKPIVILVDGKVAQTRGLSTFNVIVPSISHPVSFELNGDALEPVEETIYTDNVENGSIIKIVPYNDMDTIFSVYREGLPVNINLSKDDYTKFNSRPGYFYVALDAEQSNDIPNSLNELNINTDTLAGIYLQKSTITEEDLNYVINNFNKDVLEYFVVNNKPFTELQTVDSQTKVDEDATKIKEDDGALHSIPNYTFKDYVNLKVVKLPNNITHIGKEAFKNTKIFNLGNGNIESIDDQAFENCQNLDADFIQTISRTTKHLGYRAFAGSSICGPTMDLDLGKISEIGDECFADCNFKDLILTDYNLKIGSKAFRNCTFQGIINFSNVKNLNSLTANSSIERNLNIQPSTFEKCIINGAGGIKFNTSVTEIPEHMFEGCNFKDLQIPAHIHTIGSYAFANIEGKATLRENTSLDRVGNHAFYNVKDLTIKKFPEKLTFVGDYAFANTHISNDIVLNNVEVGTSSFENVDSKNLFIKGNVSVVGNNPFFSTRDTVNVEYDKGSTDEGFFNGKNVLNVVFKDISNLKEIPYFNGCIVATYSFYQDVTERFVQSNRNKLAGSLTTYVYDDVTIHNNVFKYLEYADKLILYKHRPSVKFGNNVTFKPKSFEGSQTKIISSLPNTTKYKNDFFNDIVFKKRDSVVVLNLLFDERNNFPSKALRNVGENLFVNVLHTGNGNVNISKNDRFDNLIIIEPVDKIPNNLCEGTAFKTIILPTDENGKGTVKTIGNSAFRSCRNLNSILGISNVTTIGNNAFENDKKLNQLGGLKYTKSIGIAAFRNSGLRFMDLSGNPLNDLGVYAFADCDSLILVDMSNTNIQTIPQYCFSNDTLLRYFIPGKEREGRGNKIANQMKRLTTIDQYAFAGCKRLHIEVPDNVKYIEPYAFTKCTNLNIGLHEGLEKIGKWAFYKSAYMKAVNIPKSVKSIGEGAFVTENPNKQLVVKFNWKDSKDIIPYETKEGKPIWPYGMLIMQIPDDDYSATFKVQKWGGLKPVDYLEYIKLTHEDVRFRKDLTDTQIKKMNLVNTNRYYAKGYGRTDEILKKRDKTLIEEWEGEYGYQALKEGEDYGGINTEGWVAIATGATAGTIGLIEGGLMLAMGINSALLAHAVTAAQAALTAFELGYTLVESVSITVEVLKNSEHILSETLTIAQNAYNIGNISALLSTNLVASVVGAIIGVFAIALTVISIVFTVLSLVHKHNYMQYKNGMYVSQLSSEIIRPKKTPNLSGQDKEIIGYYPSGEIILIDDGTKVKDSSNKTAEEIFKKQRKHRVVEEESEATTRSGDYHRYIDIDLDPNVPRPIDFIPFNQR